MLAVLSSEGESEQQALVRVEGEDPHGRAPEHRVPGPRHGPALALELRREARLRREEREAHERRGEVRRLHDGLVLQRPRPQSSVRIPRVGV